MPLLSPSTADHLADAVLVLHVAIAVFVVAGLPLILAGHALRWRWATGLWFRLAHLAAIAIIVAESWFGIACPLTTLEMALRERAGAATYGGGFIEHWFQRLLFYDAPAWIFTCAYTVFGALVLSTWWFVPPRRRAR